MSAIAQHMSIPATLPLQARAAGEQLTVDDCDCADGSSQRRHSDRVPCVRSGPATEVSEVRCVLLLAWSTHQNHT